MAYRLTNGFSDAIPFISLITSYNHDAEPCIPVNIKTRSLLFLALFFYGALSVIALATGGVTWDEVLDFEGVNGAFWHAVNTLKGHSPDYKTITFDLEFYGNFTRWPVYLIWRLFQVFPWENLQGFPRTSFVIVSGYIGLNHFSSILYGVFTAYLLYKLSSLLWPSSKYLAPALLLTLPVWIGHSWFNSKDVPVAFAYTLYTLGSTILIKEVALDTRNISTLGKPVYLLGKIRICPSMFARALGIAALLGSRLGMLPFVLASDFLICALKPSGITFRRIAGSLFGGIAAAYLATPQAWSSPLTYVVDTISHYSARTSGASSLGTLVYILGNLFDTLPLIVTVGLLCFLQALKPPAPISKIVPFVPIFLQGFLVPAALVVGGKGLYNELRQVLFIYPSLIFFSSIGLSRFVALSSGDVLVGPRFSFKGLMPMLLGLAWLVLLLDLVFISPFQYLYRSEVSRIVRPNHALRRDYWGFSVRELMVNCFRSTECASAIDRLPLLRNGWSWNPDLVDAYAFLISPKLTPDDKGVGSKDHLRIFSGGESSPYCRTLAKVKRGLFSSGGQETIYSLKQCRF